MVVMVDLVNRPHFFIKAVMGLDISKVVCLAISRVVLMETNIAIGFFGLSLW